MTNEWDIVAADYSRLIGESGDVWRQVLINPAIIKALQPLPPGSRILDLGCGEGYLARILAPHGWSYTGIDNSRTLLNTAGVKKSPGEFVQADITKPIEYQHQFETVIVNMVLMDVDNAGAVYQNAWRMLKHKGLLVVTIPHPAFRRPGAKLAKTLFSKIFRLDPFIRINSYTKSFFQKGRLPDVSKPTIVFHRPLSLYIQIALDQGFKLLDIEELAPVKNDLIKWKQPLFFTKFPQILFMVFSKDE